MDFSGCCTVCIAQFVSHSSYLLHCVCYAVCIATFYVGMYVRLYIHLYVYRFYIYLLYVHPSISIYFTPAAKTFYRFRVFCKLLSSRQSSERVKGLWVSERVNNWRSEWRSKGLTDSNWVRKSTTNTPIQMHNWTYALAEAVKDQYTHLNVQLDIRTNIDAFHIISRTKSIA